MNNLSPKAVGDELMLTVALTYWGGIGIIYLLFTYTPIGVIK